LAVYIFGKVKVQMPVEKRFEIF